jgi:hypothetical protein
MMCDGDPCLKRSAAVVCFIIRRNFFLHQTKLRNLSAKGNGFGVSNDSDAPPPLSQRPSSVSSVSEGEQHELDHDVQSQRQLQAKGELLYAKVMCSTLFFAACVGSDLKS